MGVVIMFHFCLCYFCAIYSKRCPKNVRDRFKNRDHANKIILSIIKNVERTSTTRTRVSPESSTCEVPCDVSIKLQLSLCAIMAS